MARLRAFPHEYAPFVPGEEFGAYMARMAQETTWGDHVTLQAAADSFGVRVVVISSYDPPLIEIAPDAELSSRALFLSFHAEVHYNSVYPATEAAPEAPPAGEGRWGALPSPERVRRWLLDTLA